MSLCRRRHRIALLLIGVAFLLPCGCNVLQISPLAPDRQPKEATPGLPAKHSFRVSQFVFVSDFEIKRNAPVFRELSNLREQVFKDLQLPPSNNVVQVYIFEDREKYERFMQLKYPDLPKRRAFFVAQPKRLGGTEDLLVYTYWGDRVRQDLRHELTHALLHSVLKDVPLWLDEGLAEYFEIAPGLDGVNAQHLEQMRRGPTGPAKADLARLEQLSEVQQMSPAEYRESWAWVHLMLRSTPQARQVLISYLQELRTNPRPGPMRPRLATVFLSLDTALENHLANLDKSQPARRLPSVKRTTDAAVFLGTLCRAAVECRVLPEALAAQKLPLSLLSDIPLFVHPPAVELTIKLTKPNGTSPSPYKGPPRNPFSVEGNRSC
jgi:hypothetical protein